MILNQVAKSNLLPTSLLQMKLKLHAIFQYKVHHYCLGHPVHYQKNEAKVCILAAGICRVSHMKDPLGFDE